LFTLRKRSSFFRVKSEEGKPVKTLEKIKEALKPLQQIEGVEGCWVEEEEGDIVHVYAVTREADYDLDKRIFQEYAEVEKRFPEVSFEFLTTSRPPSPFVEVVFFSPHQSSPVAEVAVS
jgi:hypothetical protein